MGLFDFFNKKKQAKLSPELDDFLNQSFKLMFPGGKKERRKQVRELKALLKKKYKDATIASTLAYMTSHILFSEEKSADRVVYRGALVREDNKFTEEDALIIYKFVVRQQYKKVFPNNNEEGFKFFYSALGNNEGGATTDIIPGAYGEYGLCCTNPIPVRGVPASEIYLRSLRLLSGESITWERVFSVHAPNIDNPIDLYSISMKDGKHICDIYISPYQNVISSTAPKGFYIE